MDESRPPRAENPDPPSDGSGRDSIGERCAEPDPAAESDPCVGLDWQACDEAEACEPRRLDPGEPGYPGTFCGWVGVPGEPGYGESLTAAAWVDCDPSAEPESECEGLVCVPVIDECRDRCSRHADCLHGFYCGDNGVGVTHCVECGATPGYVDLVDG